MEGVCSNKTTSNNELKSIDGEKESIDRKTLLQLRVLFGMKYHMCALRQLQSTVQNQLMYKNVVMYALFISFIVILLWSSL